MDKPISVILNDAKQTLVDTINGLNLHPSILEPIMRDLYNEVRRNAEVMYKREKDEYEASIKLEKEKSDQE